MSQIHDDIPFRRRIKIWTRNALIVSVAVHVLFGVISGFVVALRHLNKPQAQFVSPPLRPKLEPRKLEMKVKVQDLQKRSARPKLQPRMVALSPTDLALPEIKVDPKALKQKVKRKPSRVGIAGIGSGIGGGSGTGAGGGMGAGMKLPAMLSARCDVRTRTARLESSGGSQRTEEAVMKALRWLKKTQREDGSWGEHSGSMTGFALLAFLGHCETPSSPEFGVTVRKAIDYLVGLGEGGGSLAGRGGRVGYQHGIATYALAEAYAMTRMSKIAPVLEQAATRIIKGQTPPGGWMYGYGGETTDMSVAGWQMQALKSVHIGGLKVDGLEECLDKAIEYLFQIQNGDGGFPYRPEGGSSWTLTGVGVLGLQMWKHPRSKEVRRGVDLINDSTKTGLDYKGGSTRLYGWYYNTLACYMKGGSEWRLWNRKFRRELVNSQESDGSWPEEGGGILTKHAKADGEHMRTCLCTLMLEVYYRFLPTTS